MKPRICPKCSCRNFTANPLCSRCNEPLPAVSEVDTRKQSTEWVTLVNPPTPIEEEFPLTPVTPAHLAPPPIPESETTLTPTTPFTPKHLATFPLPAYLIPLGAPLVEGEVVDSASLQNEDKGLKAGDVIHMGLSTALLVVNPIYGIMSIASGVRKPKEMKNIITFRVRTTSGILREVRIEKDVVGVSISIGDHVSIWGRDDHGAVILRNAFNHTVNGEVRIK